jgi:hypothetical protein
MPFVRPVGSNTLAEPIPVGFESVLGGEILEALLLKWIVGKIFCSISHSQES